MTREGRLEGADALSPTRLLASPAGAPHACSWLEGGGRGVPGGRAAAADQRLRLQSTQGRCTAALVPEGEGEGGVFGGWLIQDDAGAWTPACTQERVNIW